MNDKDYQASQIIAGMLAGTPLLETLPLLRDSEIRAELVGLAWQLVEDLEYTRPPEVDPDEIPPYPGVQEQAT